MTVKVRLGGGAEVGPGSWTNLRVAEAELALPSLRRLLATALQCSPASLPYLQYEDADGDWLTVCNDADILDGVDELGGSLLHLQVLWRGARDAFQPGTQQPPPRQPALGDRSAGTGERPRTASSAPASERERLSAVIDRGDIEALADTGELAGAIKLGERAVAANLPLSVSTINRVLLACTKRNALPEAIAAFKVMKKSDLDPDRHTFDAMISLGVECGDLSLAVKALKACLKARLQLDAGTVKRLRSACDADAVEVKQAVWKAAHRQLCLQSARQHAQGEAGIAQADLDAIVSSGGGALTDASSAASTANPPTADGAGVGAGSTAAKRARYAALVGKIMDGTASDAEQNEAEKLGTRCFADFSQTLESLLTLVTFLIRSFGCLLQRRNLAMT